MSEQDFNFEEFIKQNELTVIKQCLINHEMTTIDTLNMNNPQFTKLMGDKTILSNAHLIQNIVHGIQSLEKLRNSSSPAEKAIIFTSQKEHNTFTTIENFIDNFNTFETELQTTINNNIKNRQQQNDKDITKYTTQNSDKLSTIHEQIDQKITALHNTVTEQEKLFENKITEYRNNVKKIDLTHQQNSKNINNTLSTCLSIIDKDIKYFQDAIKQCRNIVHKYEEQTDKNIKNNDKFTFKRSNTTHRENEIISIGTKATDYYDKNMSVLTDNKNKITHYNENELILNMKQIYSLTINDNIYNTLDKNINKLIALSNNIINDDYKQEPVQIIIKAEPNKPRKMDDNQSKIVVTEIIDEPPAAFSPNNSKNFGIVQVPIPRIQPKPNGNIGQNQPPPRYNPRAPVVSMEEVKRINSKKAVAVDEKQNINEGYGQHAIETSISLILDANNPDQADLIKQMEKLENRDKSHSPPAAFEQQQFWACNVCTFAENPGSFLICKICGSSRQLAERRNHLPRQRSFSNPRNSPPVIPQSKSELQFRAKSDENSGAKVKGKKGNGKYLNANGNGNGNKKPPRSQSISVKQKKSGGFFKWGGKKSKSKKNSKSQD